MAGDEAATRRGGVRFEVEPDGPRRWTIETGLATVEVVGTVFEVERAPGAVDVRVERGVVVVRGERVPTIMREVEREAARADSEAFAQALVEPLLGRQQSSGASGRFTLKRPKG